MTQATPEQAPAEHMEAVCAALSEVLKVAGGPLARVRINLGGAELEVDWPQAPMGAPAAAVPAAATAERSPGEQAQDEGHHVVRAPLVGTFYVASEPDAEPFVRGGQRVDKGETIGIVEAMKLMNHVAAEVAGTVVAVHADNGEPVEFDQPLVTIDPDPAA